MFFSTSAQSRNGLKKNSVRGLLSPWPTWIMTLGSPSVLQSYWLCFFAFSVSVVDDGSDGASASGTDSGTGSDDVLVSRAGSGSNTGIGGQPSMCVKWLGGCLNSFCIGGQPSMCSNHVGGWRAASHSDRYQWNNLEAVSYTPCKWP